MKKFMKTIALCLSLLLCLSFPMSVSAASVSDATIDLSAKGSLTIYKTDLTNAEKDGVWDSSYVSTGVANQMCMTSSSVPTSPIWVTAVKASAMPSAG